MTDLGAHICWGVMYESEGSEDFDNSSLVGGCRGTDPCLGSCYRPCPSKSSMAILHALIDRKSVKYVLHALIDYFMLL